MNNENPELEIEQPENQTQAEDIPADLADTIAAGSGSGGATIESLQEQLAAAEKRALLHQADLENFRRRKSKESQDALRYASLPLINGLLEVLDNLQRALESAKDDENSGTLREGVELVATQLLATLENHGCKRIEALGQAFDPNRHEAIQMQPSDEPNNIIIMEVQSGFMLHDRVVRPAKVIISTGPANQ